MFRYITNYYSYLFLPQNKLLLANPRTLKPQTEKKDNVTLSRIKVNNDTENIKLETVIIEPDILNNYKPEDIKVIIVLPDLFESFENKIPQLIKYAKDLNCHVISFNYRGTHDSTGTLYSKNDLFYDCISQIKRLGSSLIKPCNIILKGTFLGGSVAAHVAALCHSTQVFTDPFPINVFCDRAYNNIDYIKLEHISDDSRLLSKIQSALPIFSIYYNSSYYYNQISPKYKAYSFLIKQDSQGINNIDNNSLDFGIDHTNSIHGWGFIEFNGKLTLASNPDYNINNIFYRFSKNKFNEQKLLPKPSAM